MFAPGPDPAAWSEWTISSEVLYYLEHGTTSSILHAVPLDAPQASTYPLDAALFPGGGLATAPNGKTLHLVSLDRAESDIQKGRLAVGLLGLLTCLVSIRDTWGLRGLLGSNRRIFKPQKRGGARFWVWATIFWLNVAGLSVILCGLSQVAR